MEQVYKNSLLQRTEQYGDFCRVPFWLCRTDKKGKVWRALSADFPGKRAFEKTKEHLLTDILIYEPPGDIQGERIYCEAFYREHHEEKGTVLISHGFTESTAKYPEVVCHFLDMGYRVYIFDHCGHGQSYRLTDDLSLIHIDHYQRYIRDCVSVARFIHHQEGQKRPLILFGHSMGGGIAAAASARHPELFDRVILSSPMIQPAMGTVPYHLAAGTAELLCLVGKGENYVTGHGPYGGREDFAQSAALSRERFDYYQDIKEQQPLYQTSAPSYGWLRESVRLSVELWHKSWKTAVLPMLLFQAGKDAYVINEAQEEYAKRRNRIRPGSTEFVKIPDSKHEIYCAEKEILTMYWEKIARFLDA